MKKIFKVESLPKKFALPYCAGEDKYYDGTELNILYMLHCGLFKKATTAASNTRVLTLDASGPT